MAVTFEPLTVVIVTVVIVMVVIVTVIKVTVVILTVETVVILTEAIVTIVTVTLLLVVFFFLFYCTNLWEKQYDTFDTRCDVLMAAFCDSRDVLYTFLYNGKSFLLDVLLI